MTRTRLSWRALEPPRRPAAVLARAEAAGRLALATHARSSVGPGLRAAGADGVLIVVGPEEELPWAEGVTYLGREDGVLLPTTLAPSVPPGLLRQVLQAQGSELVVVPGEVLAFTTATAPPDPAWLLDRARGPAA